MFKKLFVILLFVAMATAVIAEDTPSANDSGIPTPPNPDFPSSNESATSGGDSGGSSGGGSGGSSGGGGGGGSSGGSSGTSGSSSSGYTACFSDWICEPWSACQDGLQTRTCYDANGCSTPTNMPSSERACEEVVDEVIIEPEQEEVLLPQEESSNSLPLILGVTLGALALIGIVIFAFFYLKKPSAPKNINTVQSVRRKK